MLKTCAKGLDARQGGVDADARLRAWWAIRATARGRDGLTDHTTEHLIYLLRSEVDTIQIFTRKQSCCRDDGRRNQYGPRMSQFEPRDVEAHQFTDACGNIVGKVLDLTDPFILRNFLLVVARSAVVRYGKSCSFSQHSVV